MLKMPTSRFRSASCLVYEVLDRGRVGKSQYCGFMLCFATKIVTGVACNGNRHLDFLMAEKERGNIQSRNTLPKIVKERGRGVTVTDYKYQLCSP